MNVPNDIKCLIDSIIEDGNNQYNSLNYNENYRAIENYIVESYKLIGRNKKFVNVLEIVKLIHNFEEVEPEYLDIEDIKNLLIMVKEPTKLSKAICKSANKRLYIDFNSEKSLDLSKIFIPSENNFTFGINGIKLLFKNSKITKLMTGIIIIILAIVLSVKQSIASLSIGIFAIILWAKFITAIRKSYIKYIK